MLGLKLFLLPRGEEVDGEEHSAVDADDIRGHHLYSEGPALLPGEHLIQHVAVQPRGGKLLAQTLLHPLDPSFGSLGQDLRRSRLAHPPPTPRDTTHLRREVL